MTELIKPELQSFFCSEIDDISGWVPDGEVVDYWLQLDVGEVGRPEASEQFQVRVVDSETLGREAMQPLRACVVVEVGGYSFEAVRATIATTIGGCGQRTWFETAVAISRYFLWEYEGYPLEAVVDQLPQQGSV